MVARNQFTNPLWPRAQEMKWGKWQLCHCLSCIADYLSVYLSRVLFSDSGIREREKEKKGERETERQRQTDRQTDRQQRQRQRQTERDRDRQTHRDTQRQRERQTDRQRERETVRERERERSCSVAQVERQRRTGQWSNISTVKCEYSWTLAHRGMCTHTVHCRSSPLALGHWDRDGRRVIIDLSTQLPLSLIWPSSSSLLLLSYLYSFACSDPDHKGMVMLHGLPNEGQFTYMKINSLRAL